VLDSFAVLAYLNNEAAAPFVRDLLHHARKGTIELWMSQINYGECVYIVERNRGLAASRRCIAIIDQLPILIAEADRTLIFDAAHIKARHPMSYADAFSAALSKSKNAVLLTGDPEFKSIEEAVSIHWLPLI
jgi:ribonuclease VapC